MNTTAAAPAAKVRGSAETTTEGPGAAGQRRLAAFAGGGIVLLVLVAWFVVLSGRRKEEFAARALEEARAAAEVGNLPLAASQLQKVVSTYDGTDASKEAAIMINQVRLGTGQAELAVVGMRDFIKAGPGPKYLAQAYALLGRALENTHRPSEAADAYVSASGAATAGYLRADYLTDAGRAFTQAEQSDKAIETYRKIIREYPKSSQRTEAEVRLAELTGGKL